VSPVAVSTIKAYVVAALAALVGSVSLLLFGVFLVWGPALSVQLGLGEGGRLVLDGALSFAFFTQHSVMIRRNVRARLERLISGRFYGAAYAVASGVVLLGLVLMWQESDRVLFDLQGVARWLLRCVVLLAAWLFVSGVRALRSFDTFGINPIVALVKNEPEVRLPLVARGAYRWVRHPVYLSLLLVVWSHPTMTPDRLLFNILWSVWVVTATMLEERDLVAAFGDAYRKYQEEVPMIIPWKVPRR
jgi:protein-S-isoprenylcysteine O-methyltransferase Ste14